MSSPYEVIRLENEEKEKLALLKKNLFPSSSLSTPILTSFTKNPTQDEDSLETHPKPSLTKEPKTDRLGLSTIAEEAEKEEAVDPWSHMA